MTTPSTSYAHLRVDGLSFSYGERRVLTDLSFVVPAGERTGLIGENGSGKSTVLRLIAGHLTPDAGTVRTSGGSDQRIGLLHQEPPFDRASTVHAALEEAVAPLRRMAAAVAEAADRLADAADTETTGDAERAYDRALSLAEERRVWEVDSRIATMMAGLGLADLPPERQTGQLSGGQRARLSLAWVLLSAPDVLLLDEPTNHLDDAATAHLRAVLADWRGPVLLASHDRAFLDDAVTTLLDLDPAPSARRHTADLRQDGPGGGIGLTRFTGRYSGYVATRRETRRRWWHQYRDEQSELARLEASIRDSREVGHVGAAPRTEARASKKFYADRNATVVARRVNDARARRDALAERQVARPPVELRFTPPRPEWDISDQPGPVLVVTDIAVPGRLPPTSLSISTGGRLLITGINGSGKSTLLQVLAGDLEPGCGVRTAAPGLRVGLLSQEVRLPDPPARGASRSVADTYTDLAGAERAELAPLADFGLFHARDLHRPVAALSVGQQRRLALAVVLADPPDVLLLDEPTNHFSLLLVDELEAALEHYPGTVVLASHDRWLRSRWGGQRFDLTSAP